MTAALALLAAGICQAQVIKHVGNNDPTTEGWTHISTGGTVSPGTETTPPNVGTNYWQIDTGGGEFNLYKYVLTTAQLSTPWQAIGRWRLLSMSGVSQLENDSLIVEDGTSGYFLGLEPTGLYYLGPGFTDNPLITFPLDTTHYYQIEMDKNLVTSKVNVFLDGAFVGFLSPNGSGGPNEVVADSNKSIAWGDATTTSTSVTERWNYAAFDIPEPGALWLLSLGGLLLWRRKQF
jgi:hypothetical protein